MPYPSQEDSQIARELMHQVALCAKGDAETTVRTWISRPLWEAFCRFTGAPEGQMPTPWLGIHKTHRVYGSETIVVESDAMFAICRKIY